MLRGWHTRGKITDLAAALSSPSASDPAAQAAAILKGVRGARAQAREEELVPIETVLPVSPRPGSLTSSRTATSDCCCSIQTPSLPSLPSACSPLAYSHPLATPSFPSYPSACPAITAALSLYLHRTGDEPGGSRRGGMLSWVAVEGQVSDG